MSKDLLIIFCCFASCFVFLLTGCTKKKCDNNYTYSYYTPVYKTKEAVRANIKSNPSKAIENPGKIFIYGQYVFLNEVDKGVHVIDNSNPSSPKNIGFIDVPGNVDLAVKENIMYADMYTDLVAIDISNPRNVVIKKIIDGVFPYRYWGGGFVADNSMVVTEWIKHDTTVEVSCDDPGIGYNVDYFDEAFTSSPTASSASGNSSPVGKGGSMARFTLVNTRLYTVTNSNINVFDVAAAANPSFTNTINVGAWNIETIFPFKNKLFIGSNTGMYIYSLTDPANPALEGQFTHLQSCDPVIADDDFAYVTLRSGNNCMSTLNQMDVLDIADMSNPTLIKTYPMTNPHGLSKDGKWLFICDGTDGLKVFDASNVNDIKLKKQIKGIETYDVITDNKIAIVVAKDGLYQYGYSNVNSIRLISKILIARP